jgi:hypothetical protein
MSELGIEDRAKLLRLVNEAERIVWDASWTMRVKKDDSTHSRKGTAKGIGS